MPQSRRLTSESRRPTHALRLLHAIIREPDCLETGLRLLGMENVRGGDAYLAFGMDQAGQRVVLYVTSRGVRGHEVCTAFAHVTRLRGNQGYLAGRILVVAAAFDDDLLHGSPDVLGGWGIELCLWTDDAEDAVADEDMTESPVPGLARSEGPNGTPALSPEEVESLVGS